MNHQRQEKQRKDEEGLKAAKIKKEKDARTARLKQEDEPRIQEVTEEEAQKIKEENERKKAAESEPTAAEHEKVDENGKVMKCYGIPPFPLPPPFIGCLYKMGPEY